jgi:hypothetical protein
VVGFSREVPEQHFESIFVAGQHDAGEVFGPLG